MRGSGSWEEGLLENQTKAAPGAPLPPTEQGDADGKALSWRKQPSPGQHLCGACFHFHRRRSTEITSPVCSSRVVGGQSHTEGMTLWNESREPCEISSGLESSNLPPSSLLWPSTTHNRPQAPPLQCRDSAKNVFCCFLKQILFFQCDLKDLFHKEPCTPLYSAPHPTFSA